MAAFVDQPDWFLSVKPSQAPKRVAGQPRPRSKPAEVRLEELMAAAQSLFLSQGVEATTISEIVSRAEVAKGLSITTSTPGTTCWWPSASAIPGTSSNAWSRQ
ncbi:TetR/AcrR family transcriptional regulator [Pseudomonas sp. Fl4BN1]|uniref:TetR/AcrR family transcriptional regulator n=1 Tax=Pseudomonas sp. Fl4BN1 TaxID=2697651 RepID=UPI00355727D2